jgi:hypothetical protein
MDALPRDEAEKLARRSAAQARARDVLARGEHDAIAILVNIGWMIAVVVAGQSIDLPLIARLVVLLPAATCVPLLFRLRRAEQRLEAALVLLGVDRTR